MYHHNYPTINEFIEKRFYSPLIRSSATVYVSKAVNHSTHYKLHFRKTNEESSLSVIRARWGFIINLSCQLDYALQETGKRNKKAVLSQSTLHMGALKILGIPWLLPRPLFPIFSWAFVRVEPVNVPTKFEVRSFTRCRDNRGTQKNWTVPGYAHDPFSENFLMGFCSDRPCKYTRQIWSP